MTGSVLVALSRLEIGGFEPATASSPVCPRLAKFSAGLCSSAPSAIAPAAPNALAAKVIQSLSSPSAIPAASSVRSASLKRSFFKNRFLRRKVIKRLPAQKPVESAATESRRARLKPLGSLFQLYLLQISAYAAKPKPQPFVRRFRASTED